MLYVLIMISISIDTLIRAVYFNPTSKMDLNKLYILI